MDTAVVSAFLEQINEKIDPALLLQRIAYATDKIQVADDSIKAFCPIHKDARFRSLIIDSKKHSYKCTIKTCEGYGGGTLVDLYAKSRKMSDVAAAQELIGALDLPVDQEHVSKLAVSYCDEAQHEFLAGNLTAAEEAATVGLQFSPGMLEARLLLANIYKQRGEPSRACDEYVVVAETYLAHAQFSEADKLLEDAAREYSDCEDIFFLQVRSAELQGNREREIAILESVALQRENAGRNMDNLGIYEKLLEYHSDDVGLRLKLAELYESRRDIKRATREWDKAATTYMESGKGELAVPLLEKALVFEPQNFRMRMRLAEELLRQGEYVAAKDQIFTVINQQIENADFNAAEKSARKWLEVEPESVDTHESLARIFQEQGQSVKAASEMRTAAMYSDREGNAERALEFLFRSKFFVPDDIEVRQELIAKLREMDQAPRAFFEMLDMAEVYFGTGKTEEGTAVLHEATTLAPSAEFKLQAASAYLNHQMPAEAKVALIESAKQAEAEENYETAHQALQQLLDLEPGNLDYRTRHCKAAWSYTGGTATLESTTALIQELLSAERRADAEELLLVSAARASEHPPHAFRLLGPALQASAAKSVVILYPAARRWFAEIEPEEALETAKHTLRVAPDYDLALNDLAEISRQMKLHGDAAEALLTLSTVYEKRGDLISALRQLDSAMTLNVTHSEVLRRRAHLLSELSDPEEARRAQKEYLRVLRDTAPAEQVISEYKNFIAQYGDDFDAKRALAELFARAGQVDEAKEFYASLIDEAESMDEQDVLLDLRERRAALDPDDLEVQCELAAAFADAGKGTRAQRIFSEVADKALARGENAIASRAAEAAVNLSPDDLDLVEKLAHAQRASGNKKAFAATMAKLSQSGRPQLEIEYTREAITNALRDNKPKDAEKHAKRWTELAPADPAALEQFADILAQQDRTQRAIEAYIALAELLRGNGDIEAAVAALRKASQVDPEDVQARQIAAQLLLESGRQDEAMDEMQHLADVYIERRSYKDASTLLSRILEYRTNSIDTLKRLGSLVYEHEGMAKALPHFRKLLAVIRETGSPADVVQEYEALLRLDNANIELRIEYAEYLEGAGELEPAKNQLLQIAQVFRDELNDPLRAIQFFGRATTLAPAYEDARIFEELASLHLAVNVPEFAAEALREAIRLYEAQSDDERSMVAMHRLVETPAVRTSDMHRYGDILLKKGMPEEALVVFKRAMSLAVESSFSKIKERRMICEKILELDPLNTDCVVALIDWLPTDEIPTRAIDFGQRFRDAGRFEDHMRVLERAKTASPSHLALHRELIAITREQGNTDQLRHYLIDYARTAIDEGDMDAGRNAIQDLGEIATSAQHLFEIAPLQALCGDKEKAAVTYCSAADGLCEASQFDDAAEALRQAVSLDPSTVPAAQVATLLRRSEGRAKVVAAANSVLDTALLARSRTRALVIGTALLELSTDDMGRDILRRIHDRAGAAFAVAIGGAYADSLLDKNKKQDAISVAEYITSLSSTSPDAWWLAAQLHRKVGSKDAAAAASLKAARFYSEAGAITEEEICYRETLEEFPDDAAILETLAFFYERERRISDAADMMKRLSMLAQKGGDHAKSVQWLQRAAEVAPDDAEARELLVEQLMPAGRGDEAVRQLVELAKQYARQGDFPKSAASYERVLALDENNDSALTALLEVANKTNDLGRITRYSYKLADLRAEAGAYGPATQILKNLVDRDPDNMKALEKMSGLFLRTQDEKGYINTIRELGHKSAKRGDYAHAIQHFEAYLDRRPQDRDVYQILVDCCAAEGEKEKAADYAEKILAMSGDVTDPAKIEKTTRAILLFDPKRPAVRRKLAEALYTQGKTADAVSEWLAAGEQYFAAKDFGNAAVCLNRVTGVAPENVAAWKRYADILLLCGDADSSREASLHLADTYTANGDYANAVAVITPILQMDPDDVAVHEKLYAIHRKADRKDSMISEARWLIDYHLRNKKYGEAETYVREGLEVDPENLQLQEAQLQVLQKMGRGDEIQFRLRELAKRLLAQEDYAKAAEIYEQLRDLDPEVIETRKQLLSTYMKLDRENSAAEECFNIAALLLQRGDSEEAREMSEVALRSMPGNLFLRARLAEAFASHNIPEVASRYYISCAGVAGAVGDSDDQLRYLRLAVQTRPRSSDALRLLAETSLKAARNEEAAESFAKLADVLVEQKHFTEAIDVLKRTIQLNAKAPEPRRQLIQVYERTGDKDSRVSELKDLADLLLSRGRTDDAVEAYRELVGLRPDDTTILQKYIDLFGEIGNELEIIDDYMRLAEAYTEQGALNEATQTYERVLAIDRRNKTARERFIHFLQTHGQKTRAVKEMQVLADAYMKSGNAPAAVRTLTQAANLSGSDSAILGDLAEAQAAAGDADAAAQTLMRAAVGIEKKPPAEQIATFKKMLQIAPHNLEARERYGEVLVKQNHLADAAENLRKIAAIHAEAGDIASAEAAYNSAAEYDPETSELLKRLITEHLAAGNARILYVDYVRAGDLFADAGDIDKALDHYRKAREIDDENPDLIQKYLDNYGQIAPEHETIPDLILLAQKCTANGDKKRAFETYNHVLLLDPKNPDAKAAREKIS